MCSAAEGQRREEHQGNEKEGLRIGVCIGQKGGPLQEGRIVSTAWQHQRRSECVNALLTNVDTARFGRLQYLFEVHRRGEASKLRMVALTEKARHL